MPRWFKSLIKAAEGWSISLLCFAKWSCKSLCDPALGWYTWNELNPFFGKSSSSTEKTKIKKQIRSVCFQNPKNRTHTVKNVTCSRYILVLPGTEVLHPITISYCAIWKTRISFFLSDTRPLSHKPRWSNIVRRFVFSYPLVVEKIS